MLVTFTFSMHFDANAMAQRLLKVAWISFFPIERLPELPEILRNLPPLHPATWQRVLLDELRTNPQLKLDVIVVRKQFPKNCSFEWGGVTFHCLKVPPGLRTFSLFWWETFLIRGCLRKVRPDLVHAWGSERGAALVASRLGCPYLVTMQGLLEWYAQQVNLGWMDRLEACLERISLRRAKVVTTESTFAVKWLKDRYPHLEIRQAEHAPNWLFHKIVRRPRTSPVQFLSIGMITKIKGTDLLLMALDKLQKELDFRLTIVGASTPEFVAQLKNLTSTALWERIQILRNLTSEQIAEEMACATIMLFPTRADTSPNSVKEAVVAGLPVVASAVGGIMDYILPGRNGITFPAGNLDEFILAIRAAINHPLFRKGEVEQAALYQMRNYLSPKVMGERFLAAYGSVLDQKHVAVED
jgi:glycosyltransferase involved in cell wall biosynthesis